MKPKNGIGILPGLLEGNIDHLVPLCSMMQIPILVTERVIQETIELYYPEIEVIYAHPEDRLLDDALKGYDLFYYVHFYKTGNQTFFFNEFLTKNKARSVMSLHGNPDKFHDIFWIERLADEDIVLAYGPFLLDLMREKGVEKSPIISGNYRLEYYKAHASFFDARFPFEKEKTTLLYAPTWGALNTDSEQKRYFTSFFDVFEELFETLPSDIQLIVKLHPIHSCLMHAKLEEVKQRYPHIYFLDHYPVIYPLLKQVDIYLGDYSSIGYDFLYFDRPLFFVKVKEKTPLHSCGITIQDEPIYKTIKENLEASFSEKRKKLYHHVYGESKPLEVLREEIENAL